MEALGWTLLVLSVIALILYIYGIVDIVKGSFQGNIEKILWLILVIIFPIIGVILYFIFGKPRRVA